MAPQCPCPPVKFRWGSVTQTTDAVSFDSTSGGGRRLAFDRRAATATVSLGTLEGSITVGDRFVVIGGPAGQEIDVFALFHVRVSSGGPCFPVHGCAGGSGSVGWVMEDSSGSVGSWRNMDRQFAVPIRLRVGEPFPFFWTVATSTFGNGSANGLASNTTDFEWANLPAGMHIESCAGYFDDTPVATLPSLVSASAHDGVVRLEWSPPASEARELTVERRDGSSDWSTLGAPDADRTRVLYEDRSAAPGARYAYRLRWNDASGSHATAETWVEVPAAAAVFAARLTSGPVVRGPIAFALSLPTTEEVGIELFDLKGRRLDGTRWQPAVAGVATFEFRPGRTLAPGVYWIRVRQQAEQTTLRAIMLGGGR